MKTKGLWQYLLVGLLVTCLAFPAPLFAQEKPAKVFTQEVLDQLLAPIALYPDDILAHIFIASTYPLEVVQAERWVKQNKSLKGEALKTALEKQPWDTSVKSLASFPDVLTMMSEKLDWTQKLGDAFLAQQKDVMDTVQKLRRKALEAGNLKSTKEQEVKKEGDIIIVQPANPQVVYVPAYDPMVVYGTWWYPAYPPYPVYVYPPGAVMFTFAVGVAIGASWYGWGHHCDYHGGDINIDRDVNIDRPDRPDRPDRGRPETKPSGGGAKAEKWKHNPEHRQGVAYRDQATRDKYSPTNRAAVDNRQGNRGYDKSGAGVSDRTAGREPAKVQDRKSDRSGPEARGRDDALGGMDRGGQASRDSARGSESMSSARSHGGASSRSMGGGARGGGGRGGGGRR